MREDSPVDDTTQPAMSSKPSSPAKLPQTPEMTPETPPDVELPPLEEPTWEVRIRTAGGAESVAGPRWVACAMVSQLEFVHPETREPLRRADVESLEKAVQKQPAARRLPFSVLRAFELAQSQEGSKNWADGEELEEFQAAANAELEAMRAAAEKEERDRPESTARAERAAASSADGPTDKAAKVEQDFAADTAPQVTDLGGGHMLVQFSSKLSAQKFLLARRAENGEDPATAQWWSGDISFGQWQQQHRAKQRAKQRAEDGADAPGDAGADTAAERQLREMGFSGAAVQSALTTHAGNVEAAA